MIIALTDGADREVTFVVTNIERFYRSKDDKYTTVMSARGVATKVQELPETIRARIRGAMRQAFAMFHDSGPKFEYTAEDETFHFKPDGDHAQA